jgi:hypothetical protein
MADADARLELERRKVTLTQQYLSIVYALLDYYFLFYFEGNNAHVHPHQSITRHPAIVIAFMHFPGQKAQ